MNERIGKIKTHLQEHKKEYVFAGVGVVVGVTVTLIIGRRVCVTQKAQNIAVVNWKPENHLEQTVIIELPPRGHRGNRIFCNELKRFFGSQNEAARELCIGPGNLARHLKGENPHVGGYTFKNLGENLSGQVEVAA